MDFNAGAIIPAGRADARRKIIQGKLIWGASARHGESEKSINNAGMIVSRRPVYEAPFVYPLNARMPDEMRPYRERYPLGDYSPFNLRAPASAIGKGTKSRHEGARRIADA
jgi:hypothetical protein